DKIKNFPEPTNLRQLKGLLEIASYYRRFIEGFSKIAKSLNQLLKKDETYLWTEKH
ncbi:8968_t:CDS:1, partial [Cetraspora pellucida]